jgi:hypothetical protein
MSELDFDAVVKTFGFDGEQDFHRMVATVDIASPEKLSAFRSWQEKDGTKAGLLKLPVRKLADYP